MLSSKPLGRHDLHLFNWMRMTALDGVNQHGRRGGCYFGGLK